MAKLSRKEWETLRSQFESGTYKSLEAFHSDYIQPKHGQKGPTLKTVRIRAGVEHWSKRALEPQIKAECERVTIEHFARAGMTPDRVVKIAAKAMGDVLTSRDSLLAEIKSLADTKTEFNLEMLEKMVDIAKQYIADKRAAAPYMDQYYKVTGAYAPAKHEHSGKVSVSNDFAGMTPAELIADAKARLARLDALLAKGDAPWQPKQQ